MSDTSKNQIMKIALCYKTEKLSDESISFIKEKVLSYNSNENINNKKINKDNALSGINNKNTPDLLYHNYTIFCRCFQGVKRRFVLSKQPK